MTQSSPIHDPKVDAILDDFEVVPKAAVVAASALVDRRKRLGYPDDPYSPQGQELMKLIWDIYVHNYPDDAQGWVENRNEYKTNEMTTMDQVRKGTGRSLASVPYPVFQMIKSTFPNFHLKERADWLRFTRAFPVFQMANKI